MSSSSEHSHVSPLGKKTGKIEQPYTVVDALIGQFLRTFPSLKKLRYRRGEISAGSSRHYILGTDGHIFLTVDLQALTLITSLMQCDAGIIIKQQVSSEEIEAIEKDICEGFVAFIDFIQETDWPTIQSRQIDTDRALEPYAKNPRKASRRTWPEDEMAYAAIAAGENEELVFEKWKSALSKDRKLSNLRDSFWHALRAQKNRASQTAE